MEFVTPADSGTGPAEGPGNTETARDLMVLLWALAKSEAVSPDAPQQVYNRQRLHSALRYLTPEEFEQASMAKESDGPDGSGGKPTTGLPPLPQALEIPSGFPHSLGSATAYL